MFVERPLALQNIGGSTYLLFLLPAWGRFHQESFFFCTGSLYLMNISAESVQKERGFLAEKHSLLFWAAHRLPIVWAVIVQCHCCLGSRLHTQHPQSYRSLLSPATQLFWCSWFLTTAESMISKLHCPQDLQYGRAHDFVVILFLLKYPCGRVCLCVFALLCL